MPITVEQITNISSSNLVLSNGLSSEPPIKPGESREVIVGIPSRPESFIAGMVTSGFITRAISTGSLKDAMDAGKVTLNSDNQTYAPENIPSLESVVNYRGPRRKDFYDDVLAQVIITDATVDTLAEVEAKGVDLDQVPEAKTVQTPKANTVLSIDISITGQAGDYAAVVAAHTVLAPEVGASVTDADAALTRSKKFYMLVLTDGTSAKVAKFRSIDPINSAWEKYESNGASADLLVVASVQTP